MAQDSRVTLERLIQFKTLQDQHNADTFLGVHDTADKATVLNTSRTIDGVSFDGSTNITLPTKVIKVYSDNGTFYVDSIKETPFTSSSYTNPEEKLFIDVTTGKSAYWTGTELRYIAAEDIIARIAAAEKGAANGVATLGNDVKVPNAQLPDFVDDVVEVAAADKVNNKIVLYSDTGKTQPVTGEAGKIYVDVNATIDGSYRWAGTDTGFVAINSNVSSAMQATKATNDADGNQIDTSYVKKETGKGLMTDEQAEQLAELVTKKNNRDLATVPEIDALFDGEIEITTVPTLSGTLEYNGNSQSPTFTNYDPSTIMLMGTTSATNAGTYSCYMTPAPGYKWSASANPNGGKAPVYFQWSIGKATPILTVDRDNIKLLPTLLTDTFNITYNGNETVNISSSNTNIATYSRNGNTITVNAVNEGICSITVNVAETANYNSVIRTVSIKVVFTPDLEDASWSEISSRSVNGTASSIWDVGDAKTIELNGKIGDYFTADHLQLAVFILGFNHTEGTYGNLNGNHILLGGFKSSATNGNDTVLTDSNYYKDTYSKSFNMMHTKVNVSTGWLGTDMRYDILGSTDVSGQNATSNILLNPLEDTLLAALPSDFRSVLKLRQHYTNRPSGGEILVVDAISLPDVKEHWGGLVFNFAGNTHIGGTYITYSSQFQYYANGNSPARNAHYWLSTFDKNSKFAYYAYGTTNVNNNSVIYSYGLAPIFMV